MYRHAGWIEIRQSGSHKIFRNPATGEIVSVPFHGSKEVGIRLTYALLRKLRK
ncbi:MAG: type II toxin-antitoxin system HicA family toxin [Pseudobacter sp.]|uniref:type II toxin-antitoxin system HicA family toxin n=1 Tax=Pseudobacter sp. TaxID=2045420 RepID=UPI003F82015A